MRIREDRFTLRHYAAFTVITLLTLGLSVGIGSVYIPIGDVFRIIFESIMSQQISGTTSSIIMSVRLPRVLNVALVGGALALCGAAMQGLLRNPLADGSTLGVSSGAALGAVLAIALDITVPAIPLAGTVVMAMLFAFISIMFILSMSHRLDYSLSTNTIILLGVIYSMFVSSITSFIVVFSSNKIESITFWQMGSLSGSTYRGAMIIGVIVLIFGANILIRSKELDAFAISEKNAQHIGVDVKRTKLIIMISVSAIIGVCVAFSGTIGFVGLIMPHLLRKFTGPSHRKLLVASLFGGAVFLLLADLIARTVLSPIELPIGVVTSFVGSILFVYIFYNMRKVK